MSEQISFWEALKVAHREAIKTQKLIERINKEEAEASRRFKKELETIWSRYEQRTKID